MKLIKLLTLMLLSALAISAEKKSILTLTLDYRLTENGTSQYNLLLNELAEQGFEADFQFLPINRVWRTLAEDRTACTFPASAQSVELAVEGTSVADLIQSEIIDHVSYRVVVKPGNQKIISADDLVGKNIAAWNGMPNEQLVGVPGVNFIETNTEETRVKMLFNDRVDAMVGFIPDLHLVAERLGFEQPNSKDVLILWGGRNGTRLVCYDTPENRATINSFNAALAKVKASGRLREILGKFADIPE